MNVSTGNHKFVLSFKKSNGFIVFVKVPCAHYEIAQGTYPDSQNLKREKTHPIAIKAHSILGDQNLFIHASLKIND